MSLHKLTRDFTTFSNEIFRHNLSLKAIGLYVYIQNKPDGWDFSINGLMTQTSDGDTSIRSGLRELEEAGFLELVKQRSEDGKFQKGDWVVSDYPRVENQRVDNRPQVNTNEVNTNYLVGLKKLALQKENKYGKQSVLLEDWLIDELRQELPFYRFDIKDCCRAAFDWCEASGKRKKNYKAFARNWIRSSYNRGEIQYNADKQVEELLKNG